MLKYEALIRALLNDPTREATQVAVENGFSKSTLRVVLSRTGWKPQLRPRFLEEMIDSNSQAEREQIRNRYFALMKKRYQNRHYW